MCLIKSSKQGFVATQPFVTSPLLRGTYTPRATCADIFFVFSSSNGRETFFVYDANVSWYQSHKRITMLSVDQTRIIAFVSSRAHNGIPAKGAEL